MLDLFIKSTMEMNFSKMFFMFLLIYLHCQAVNAALLDWIWTEKTEIKEPMLIDGTPLLPVPFELKSDDEKFLEEAAKFTELMKVSALDTCQHKVILKIQTSCSAMSEEELAKLSVNLLNCQSQVDGRQVFPCSESMSLKDCTSPMDANMWNAYHLISNRARAVCLASRKSQFQALSEMTVNKLMLSAQEQIRQMKNLQDGQERLESMAVDTITSLDEGHKVLMSQQEKLRITNQGMQDFVAHNLRELTREKALIAAGHKELSKLTEDIRNKLDSANHELALQSESRFDNHQQIIEDLQVVRKQAREILVRVDESSRDILKKHNAAFEQYVTTLENLHKINETVNYLLQVVNMTKNELEVRLEWIQHYIGGTGDQLEKVYLIVLHLGYLFLGMLCSSFLGLPMMTRLALILVVPLNMFTYQSQGPESALDFTSLTFVLILTAFINIFINSVMSYLKSPETTRTEPLYLRNVPTTSNTTRTTTTKSTPSLKQKINNCSTSISRAVTNLVYGGASSSRCTVPADTTNTESMDDADSPLQRHDVSSSRVSRSVSDTRELDSTDVVSDWLKSRTLRRDTTPSSNRSSLSRVTCTALCKSGRTCKNSVYMGRNKCYKHLTESSN